MPRKNHLSFLLAAFALLLASARIAGACSCGPAPTVLDAYERARAIVIVRVLAVEKATEKSKNYGYGGIVSTKVVVEKVYKGNLKVGDEMTIGQGGGADCIWTFEEKDVGSRYLFYPFTLDKKRPFMWAVGTCGRGGGLDYVTEDLLFLDRLGEVRGKTRISGTISFDKDTELGIKDRTVRVIGGGKTYELKTDEHGVFEIYGLPAGKYLVAPEVPFGWKVDRFWLEQSTSFAGERIINGPAPARIPVILEEKKHASLDIHFEIDNAIRGHIYDKSGKPMNGVCLDLVPADGKKGPYLADCTEKEGAFEVDEIPPGSYVILINDDGKVSSSEPFGTFYYPNTTRREDAAVFHIGVGDFVENVQIYAPVSAETITVEGLFLYSDGKPVADEVVQFKAEMSERGVEDDARATTDAAGRFSIKILKGLKGRLFGWMYTFEGEFENCPKLDAIIRRSGESSPEVKTPAINLKADNDLYNVELKFPFPSCKKAKIE